LFGKVYNLPEFRSSPASEPQRRSSGAPTKLKWAPMH
jgi:hypothetical protein